MPNLKNLKLWKTEAATEDVLQQKVFLEISKNS